MFDKIKSKLKGVIGTLGTAICAMFAEDLPRQERAEYRSNVAPPWFRKFFVRTRYNHKAIPQTVRDELITAAEAKRERKREKRVHDDFHCRLNNLLQRDCL